MNKPLLQREAEFVQNKRVYQEIRKKEQENKEMEGFTGNPKINQTSKQLSFSNISNIKGTTKSYHNLLKTDPIVNTSQSRQRPPKPSKVSNTGDQKVIFVTPQPLECDNFDYKIMPYKVGSVPSSGMSTPISSINFSQKMLNNASQLSFNMNPSNIDITLSNISTPIHQHTRSMKVLPKPELRLKR